MTSGGSWDVQALTIPSSSAWRARRSVVERSARSSRADEVGEPAPPVVVLAGDGYPAVIAGRGVDAVGYERGVAVAVTRRDPAVHRPVEQCRCQQVQGCLSLGDVDVLALAGAPGVVDGRQCGERGEAWGDVIGVREEWPGRRWSLTGSRPTPRCSTWASTGSRTSPGQSTSGRSSPRSAVDVSSAAIARRAPTQPARPADTARRADQRDHRRPRLARH